MAEEADAATQLLQAPFEKIIGVVDCAVQDEGDILQNLQGVQEYFYVSGSWHTSKASRSTSTCQNLQGVKYMPRSPCNP